MAWVLECIQEGKRSSMRAFWKLGIASVVFGYFAACSPVQFEKMPEAPCGSEGVACIQKCTGANCIQSYTLEKRVGEGLVDILFVDDNSGSMSQEQRKMAERFPTFLQTLDARGLDYRIAITTTDVSSTFSSTPAGIKNPPSQWNGNGAYQDGKLLEFSSGLKFLTRDTPSKYDLFTQTIQRKETLDCENSNYQSCPSGDERGIFAANLTLDREAKMPEFIRPTAHLAIIVLSDEDERGMSDARSAENDNDRSVMAMYPLESYDLPETLISRFKQQFPSKTLSVHSIIVKPNEPGKACLRAQTGQSGNPFIRGTEGYSYEKLSNRTGGVVGSICESDYGAQLQQIGYSLASEVTSLPFSCRPINDDFDVTFEPALGHDVNVTADFDKMVLQIGEQLPPMTKVTLKYDCQKE